VGVHSSPRPPRGGGSGRGVFPATPPYNKNLSDS